MAAKAASAGKKTTKTTKTPAKSRPKRVGGLGRGLDALIPGTSARTAAALAAADAPATDVTTLSPTQELDDSQRVLQVPVGQIVPSPWQPRRVFDEEALYELATSIRAHGVIQPLVCRQTAPGQYELIAGERRLRAATEAGLTEVPVVLLEAEDRTAAEMALVENLQREDLNAIEEAEGYRALVDAFGLTQQEIAERVGKARASVANSLRLLDLSDEIKQMLGSNMISAGHAKVLLSLEDGDERLRFARVTAQEGISVRALEQKIQRSREQPRVRSVTPDIPGDHLALLLEKLHTRFGTNIRLAPSVRFANGRRGKGRIEIDFYGNEDLDRILELLGVVLDDDLGF